MMTSDQFFGLEKDNPHDHIRCTLNLADQDSLNSAAGGNLLERRTQDVLTIIENKSKQTIAVTTTMTAILKQFQATPPPASIKAVEEICVTCGGAHPYYQCLAISGNTFPELRDNIQGYVAAAAVNYNQGNFVCRPSALLSNKEKLLELANTPMKIAQRLSSRSYLRNLETLIEPNQGKLTSVIMKDNLAEPRVHMPNVLTTHPTLMLDLEFIPFDNSLLEFETFYFDIKETNSGGTTIYADISLPNFESFNFDFKPDPSELTSIVDSGICKNILSATNVNLAPEEDHSPLFAYVVWIFISFLTSTFVLCVGCEEPLYGFYPVDGVCASGMEMIYEMNFVRYVIQEIYALTILIRILSIALPILTTLYTPHTRLTHFPVIHQPPQEMSIQDMEDLKQQYLDEMKSSINSEYLNEIKINDLKGNFNGMSIEINKKKKLQQLEHVANLKSLLNQDSSIISSPKIDSLLEEFSDELAHIDLISPGINETDFDPKEEICLVERLLNDSSSLPKNESFHFDIPSSIRPPAKPLDDDEIEPDTGILSAKVVDDIFELYVLKPSIFPTQPTLASNEEKSPHLLSYRGFKAF
nr:hypothetical protein [Tanacetum cinerariifolium]